MFGEALLKKKRKSRARNKQREKEIEAKEELWRYSGRVWGGASASNENKLVGGDLECSAAGRLARGSSECVEQQGARNN